MFPYVSQSSCQVTGKASKNSRCVSAVYPDFTIKANVRFTFAVSTGKLNTAIKQNESSDNNASLFAYYNFYKLTNIQYYAIIAIFA